ncbi:Uncharacterised protein [Mycobacteroides abscessus subsp. abscessus]|nr:Uncharacterised protein [Mycobacteroides abscessus subsp. abscessus]
MGWICSTEPHWCSQMLGGGPFVTNLSPHSISANSTGRRAWPDWVNRYS